MSEILDLKKEPMFKEVFTQKTKESQLALKSFLSAILERKITRVQVVENETQTGNVKEKAVRLDVHVEFDDGEQVDIEMQQKRTPYQLENRMIYYICGMISSQELKRKSYDNLNACYLIEIMDFEKYKMDTKAFHTFKFNSDGIELSPIMQMITIELPKLKHLNVNSMNEKEAWAYFIKYGNEIKRQKEIKVLTQRYGGIKMAEQARDGISKDRLENLQKLWNDIAEIDRSSYMIYAERKTKEAEEKAKEAEQKAKEAEQKAKEAEQKTREAEQKTREAEQKTREAEQKTREAEQKTREAEQKTREAEDYKQQIEKLKQLLESQNQQYEEQTKRITNLEESLAKLNNK